jgi:hypothetical protein
MRTNTSHAGSFLPASPGMNGKRHMKEKTRFEQHADGWWASRKLGEDNILGRGPTKEAALADLGHQVAAFLDFLKRTGTDPEYAERTPDDRPASRA